VSPALPNDASRIESAMLHDPAPDQAFEYLMRYTMANRRQVHAAAREMSQLIRRLYPAGLELPQVAALFGIAMSRAVTYTDMTAARASSIRTRREIRRRKPA
jgi:hypothetical protein